MKKAKEKIRVVVYCRVESQLNSLQSQEKYYRRLFENNSDYELIKVYIDIGSGLNTKNKCAYKQMVKDSSKGKFDLIFVKSLSRLGRNIELILLQIRKWKEMKIGVYSEIENINTLNVQDSMIGIYLAIAQEQSRAKSENIKFGIQQRMKTGKAILNHSQFLGYTKGEDGVLIIVPEEAEIVRKIYDLYLQGNGVRKIKKYLEENNIKTVTGKTI